MKNLDKYFSEFLGTLILTLSISGSGMMGQNMTDNEAIILQGNSLAIGFTLIVLIITFGRISGAHFNPVVSLAFFLLKKNDAKKSIIYIIVQILGGCLGVMIANIIFNFEVIELSPKDRSGLGILLSETLATFGLLMIILLNQNNKNEINACLVGLYIAAAIWFMSSTSFANPAVTIARTLTNTVTGIHYATILPFILFQLLGCISCLFVIKKIYKI